MRTQLLLFLCCCFSYTLLAQPPAPTGYKWVLNPEFSDEFEGNQLDSTKWYARSPYWKHGRPPATFRASAVSVKDGKLQIKNQPLVPATEKYHIAGGAVASKSKAGHYGYYEARMKASGISMSSTFWMKAKYLNEQGCAQEHQELDIVEAIGMQKRGYDFHNFMKSNTHIFQWDCEGNKKVLSRGGNCPVVPPVHKAYHTYGCWWVDANTIHYYLDGEYKFTVHPKKPFDHPMYMHLVTETYNWEAPPTVEELLNNKINTTYYDYIRSYTLVPEWTNLLDEELSYWEKFIGVPHTSVSGLPTGTAKSDNVHVGKPMGLNNDPKKVFSVIKENGEIVLKASGEIYGGLTTLNEYENYHLTLQYKWGEKKWAPRIDKKRDAGLLYHCTGPHGAFWNVWKRMLEFQIQEGDTGDFFGLAGANAMVYSAETEDKLAYQYAAKGKKYGVGEDYGNWQCRRSEMHEKPNGEWNTIDLYVIGNEALHVVNGVVVNHVRDAYIRDGQHKIPLVKGQIQLQSEGAEIYYKNVKIKAITAFPN
ncbi:MAG: family 16 glycoside hydrolase [Bacteroidota bacterium]